MTKSTGIEFEDKVYEIIRNLVESNDFLISTPNVRLHKKKSYYSKDRDSYIICDITVEKYIGNPDEEKELYPSIIVVIECKNYSSPIPVDDVEEFHAKLQQIGADNTKGIMITSNSAFQSGAINYARSKRIALARILPDDQIDFVMQLMLPTINVIKNVQNVIKALTEKNFNSSDGEDFFSSTGNSSLESMICNLLK